MLKSVPALLLLFLFAAGCAEPVTDTGAPEPTPFDREKTCAALACRPDGKIRLKDENGSELELPVLKTPYVHNGVVSIVSGESYFVTGRIEAGRLVDLRYSESEPKAENALSFEFEQTNNGMTLIVRSSFPETVKYRAGIQLIGRTEIYDTSTCPILPAATGYELWPQPIVLIMLADFRILPPGSPQICE